MNAIKANRDNLVILPSRSPSPDEWQQKLLQVAQNQDRQAFNDLFVHFAPRIKAFAMANPYTDNPAQFADELIQEVMIKVWHKAGNYKPEIAGTSTWIFTIARNCRIDMIRQNIRYSHPLEPDELYDIVDEDSVMPFQATQQKHYERDIRKHLDALPHEQAQIITKVYMEGKSHNDIAEELQLPLGTVKSRVRLALSKLKLMVAP